MDWMDRFNNAIKYIEDNLDCKIDFDKASQIACCSTFHFRRMFSYIAEIPISQYIRNRRMTMAAFDLQSSNEKIIDIALKYGYDSPTSFNRAFQSVHGIPPSEARHKGIYLKAFPPISFTMKIKGDEQMNYKIETKQAFKIVGVKEHYKLDVEENFKQVPIFWQKTIQSGIIPTITSLIDKEPYGTLGVSTCMNGEDFDYYIAVATDKKTPENLTDCIVPKCTWAIFECIGPMPKAIQDLQKRIVTEWLPTSGYEYANAPDIEVYFDGNQLAEDYKCEVWLPITKK